MFAVVAALGLLAVSPATAAGGEPGAWGRAASSSGGQVRIATPQRKPLPELSDFALFGLGVAGLLVGRRTSRSRRG